jgi:hypothetical protein
MTTISKTFCTRVRGGILGAMTMASLWVAPASYAMSWNPFDWAAYSGCVAGMGWGGTDAGKAYAFCACVHMEHKEEEYCECRHIDGKDRRTCNEEAGTSYFAPEFAAPYEVPPDLEVKP